MDRLINPSNVFSSSPLGQTIPRHCHNGRIAGQVKNVTSDHRVAGSSPAECKSSLVKDYQAVGHCKNDGLKSVVIRLLSGFPVLLAFLTAHVRITPIIFSLLIW